MIDVPTIADMKALTTLSGAVYLYEAERHGTFAWNPADLSAQVTADIGEGIYVAPDTDPTGASGAFVRQLDNLTAVGSWFGLSADGVTSDAAKINAALSLSLVRELRLEPGTFALDSHISLSSNKTLSGAGCDITVLKRLAYAIPIAGPAQTINALNGTENVTVRDLTVNVNRAGNGGVLTDRCNGIAIGSKNFLIERCYVENVTGYAVYTAANLPHRCSGVVRECKAWNFNAGFEQTGTGIDDEYGITLIDCWAFAAPRDGGSVVSFGVECCFHQYDGASNITMIRCMAQGESVGWLAILNTADMRNYTLIDCNFSMTGVGHAAHVLATGAYFMTNLKIVASHFSAPTAATGWGTQFMACSGTASACTFVGPGVGLHLNPDTDMHFGGCHVKARVDPAGGSYVWGIYVASGGQAKWDGGTISAEGPVGKEISVQGAVRVSHDTKMIQVTAGTSSYAPLRNLTSEVFSDSLLDNFPDDATAAIGGISVKRWYRTGSTIKQRIA